MYSIMYRNLFTYSQTDDHYVAVVGYSYISQRGVKDLTSSLSIR